MNRLSHPLLALVLTWTAISLAPGRLASAQTATEYVIKPGDTLLAIAMQFGTTALAVQATNNLKNPDALQVGQRLVIPAGTASNTGAAQRAVHVVQSGDTLLAIGLTYGIGISDLTRANGLSESSVLQIGQRLVLPGVATSAAAPSQPAAPAAELIPIPLTQPAPTAIPLDVSASLASSVDTEVETMRAKLLDYYNQQRVAAGLQPLAYSFVLQTSAQSQADDCAGRGSCSHFGSDGSWSSQRIARAGFAGRITGENWAWARTADRAWEMWYTEEIPDGPHLKNIMSPRYIEVGFGIARASGGFYMLANFGG